MDRQGFFSRTDHYHAIRCSFTHTLWRVTVGHQSIGVACVLRIGDVCLRRHCSGKSKHCIEQQSTVLPLFRFFLFDRRWKNQKHTVAGTVCSIPECIWWQSCISAWVFTATFALETLHAVPSVWTCPMTKSNLSLIRSLIKVLLCCLYLVRLYQFTKIMYAIAIFLTYNLQFYVPFTLLWPRISRKLLYKYTDRAKARWEHVVRISLILVTCKFNASRGKDQS